MFPTTQSSSQVEPSGWQGRSGASTAGGSFEVKDLAHLAKSIYGAVEFGDSEKILKDAADLQARGKTVRESVTNPLIVVGHLNDALSRREFQWLDLGSKVAIARVFGLYLSITVTINHETKQRVYDTTKAELFQTVDRLVNLRENKAEVPLRFELEFAREAIKMLSDTSNRSVAMAHLIGRLVWNREVEAGLSFIWTQIKQLSRMWLVDVLLIRRCITVGRTNIKDLSVLQDIIKGTCRKNWYCSYAAVEVLGDIVRNGATPAIQRQAFFGTQDFPGFRFFYNWEDLKIKTIFVESLLKMSAVADRILRDECTSIQMQYRQHPDSNIRAIFETEEEKQDLLSKRRGIQASRRALLVKKGSLSTLSRTVKKEEMEARLKHLDQKTHALKDREEALAQQEAVLKGKQAQLDRAIDFQEELFRQNLEKVKMHPALGSQLNIKRPEEVFQEPISPVPNMSFTEQIFLSAQEKHFYVEGEQRVAIALKLIIENKHYFLRKGSQKGTLVVEYFEDKMIKKVQIVIDEKERLLTARHLSAKTLDEALVVIPSGFTPIHWIDLLLYKDNLLTLKSKETPAMHIVYTLMDKPPECFCISDGPDGNCLSLYFKKGEKILVKLIEIKEGLFYAEDPDITQTTFSSIKELLQMYHLSVIVKKHDILTPPASFTSDRYYTNVKVDDHYKSVLHEKTYSSMMTASGRAMEPESRYGRSFGVHVSASSGARRTGPPPLKVTVLQPQGLRQQSWQVARIRHQSNIMAPKIGRGKDEGKRHSWTPGSESVKEHNYLLTPDGGKQSEAPHYLLTPNKK